MKRFELLFTVGTSLVNHDASCPHKVLGPVSVIMESCI